MVGRTHGKEYLLRHGKSIVKLCLRKVHNADKDLLEQSMLFKLERVKTATKKLKKLQSK